MQVGNKEIGGGQAVFFYDVVRLLMQLVGRVWKTNGVNKIEEKGKTPTIATFVLHFSKGAPY